MNTENLDSTLVFVTALLKAYEEGLISDIYPTTDPAMGSPSYGFTVTEEVANLFRRANESEQG